MGGKLANKKNLPYLVLTAKHHSFNDIFSQKTVTVLESDYFRFKIIILATQVCKVPSLRRFRSRFNKINTNKSGFGSRFI